jgi:hypothetical protein
VVVVVVVVEDIVSKATGPTLELFDSMVQLLVMTQGRKADSGKGAVRGGVWGVCVEKFPILLSCVGTKVSFLVG